MACGITDPVGCVDDVVGGAASSVADSAFSAIAHDFGSAADSVVNWLWGQISSSTAVSLTGPAFTNELAITGTIATVIALGLFAIQVIASVIRHQPGGLVRAGHGLLVAFVAGGASIAVVNVSLAAIDSLSNGVVEVATGGTMQQLGARLLTPAALATVSNGAVEIMLALVVVAASVIVWAALMIRKLLIVVAAVFAPIAFAGSLAEITTSWVRRWIETMAALIFSKLILVIIFTVGLAMFDGAGQASTGVTQTLTQLVSGALILVLAGLSPWMAIRLVHFTGDAFATVHGQASSASAGAQQMIAAPQKLNSLAQRTQAGGSSTGGYGQPPGASGQMAAAKPPPAEVGGVAGPASGAGGSAAASGSAAATATGVGTPAAVAIEGAKAAKAAATNAAQQLGHALPERGPDGGAPPAKAPRPVGPRSLPEP